MMDAATTEQACEGKKQQAQPLQRLVISGLHRAATSLPAAVDAVIVVITDHTVVVVTMCAVVVITGHILDEQPQLQIIKVAVVVGARVPRSVEEELDRPRPRWKGQRITELLPGPARTAMPAGASQFHASPSQRRNLELRLIGAAVVAHPSPEVG